MRSWQVSNRGDKSGNGKTYNRLNPREQVENERHTSHITRETHSRWLALASIRWNFLGKPVFTSRNLCPLSKRFPLVCLGGSLRQKLVFTCKCQSPLARMAIGLNEAISSHKADMIGPSDHRCPQLKHQPTPTVSQTSSTRYSLPYVCHIVSSFQFGNSSRDKRLCGLKGSFDDNLPSACLWARPFKKNLCVLQNGKGWWMRCHVVKCIGNPIQNNTARLD